MASISFYGFAEFNFARIHGFARHFLPILQTYDHYIEYTYQKPIKRVLKGKMEAENRLFFWENEIPCTGNGIH